MMNIEEEDLKLGSAKFCIRARSLRASGAGVNASDPLSELVWSPHSGVSLKCATSAAAAEKKPFLLWNLGQEQSITLDVDHMIIEKAAPESHLLRDCDGSAVPLMKVESSAENELCRLTLGGVELPRENSLPTGTRHQVNGKGKALSEGVIYGRSSDHDDDDEDGSHESVESCNGAERCSSGVKRQIFDKGVMLGNKRMKMQIHGSRPDSSFLSWISNMTKGLSDSPSPLPLACFNGDSASSSMGFQTVFQSLYCKQADVTNNGGEKIADPIEESKEHAFDDKISPDRKCSNSAHALDEEMKITAKEACPDVPAKGNPRTSLWITRFSTNSAPRPEKGKEIADLHGTMNVVFPSEPNSSETRGESADSKFNGCAKESRSFVMKSISKVCPILPSQRFSTEGMASVFARRLDALRQHMTGKSLASSNICFFCGGCHDVHECPNVTKTELEELLLKPSTFNCDEESLSLCIRCSQSDHWAVSCPSRAALESQVAKSQIFDAIRRLRLSRAEILRWMNADAPSSHLNGYFLRLRLGKLEACQGGSSYYYLACIAAAAGEGESDYSKSNKSILVDVGGVKSYVATQHVSNHEFLEDEIEAWWCRSVGSGCCLPSLADLNSRFNHRKTLGMM